MTPEQQALSDKLTKSGRVMRCGCGCKTADVTWDGMLNKYCIECTCCHSVADGKFDTEHEAIQAWNQLKCAQ